MEVCVFLLEALLDTAPAQLHSVCIPESTPELLAIPYVVTRFLTSGSERLMAIGAISRSYPFLPCGVEGMELSGVDIAGMERYGSQSAAVRRHAILIAL